MKITPIVSVPLWSPINKRQLKNCRIILDILTTWSYNDRLYLFLNKLTPMINKLTPMINKLTPMINIS